jgi:CRP-like cAMP-binding protein
MVNPFKKTYTSKELNLFRYLSRIKVFENLSYKEMALFLPYLYLREYKMNEAVFFRNDPSNALYMVKSGKVSMVIDVNDQFEYLIVKKSGDFFGENALLRESNRINSAIVQSERAELYVLPKVNIREIFENHPTTKSKMMESLCELFDEFNVNLFKGYQSSFGFFNLSQVFRQ